MKRLKEALSWVVIVGGTIVGVVAMWPVPEPPDPIEAHQHEDGEACQTCLAKDPHTFAEGEAIEAKARAVRRQREKRIATKAP